MSYLNLKKLLTDVEKQLNSSSLSTDEMSDILDRLQWLQEVASNKETEDD